MSASKRPSVELTVRPEDEGTEVFLFDGRFRPVAEGRGRLTVQVRPGLYKVRARSGFVTHEDLIAVEGTEPKVTVALPFIFFATPAPLDATANTTPALQHIARREMPVSCGRAGSGSQLLVFVREVAQVPAGDHLRTPLAGLQLLTEDGRVVSEFARAAVVGEGEGPTWSACALELEPGVYRLRGEIPGSRVTEQAVVAVLGHQLQVFLTVRPDPTDPAVPVADLPGAAVFYSRGSFDPRSSLTRLEELARLGLVNNRQVLSDGVLDDVLRGKFDSPMLGLYGAHLYLRHRPRPAPGAALQEVVAKLRDLLGRAHPDVEALGLLSDPASVTHVFGTPPMLAVSWGLVVVASAERPELVPRTSLAATVAGSLWGDSPWLGWVTPRAPEAAAARPEPRAVAHPGPDAISAALVDLLKRLDVRPPHGPPRTPSFPFGFGQAKEAPARAREQQSIGRLVRSLGLPRPFLEARLEQLFPPKDEGELEFDATARVDAKILWYCPRESWDSLWGLARMPELNLEAFVFGAADVDPRTPSDLYATLLAGEGQVEWKWTTFNPKPTDHVVLVDAVTGEDLTGKGPGGAAVTYDRKTRTTRLYVSALPLDEWRAFALGIGRSIGQTGYGERAVFAVRRVRAAPVPASDPGALVFAGHLFAGWEAAKSRASWTEAGLRWLLGNLFARMQVLLEKDVLPGLRLSQDLHFLRDDFARTARGHVDGLKQGLWDKFPV